MTFKAKKIKDLKFYPLTPRRWKDLVTLFGERGACGGCWCMWWRLSRTVFNQKKGEGNKKALKKIVDSGEIPGVLAYSENEPVGWCAVTPRERYPSLERSRILKRVDDQPVWSVVCLFIDKSYRLKGVSVELLKAVVEYAEKNGAKIIEAYPVEPKKEKMPDLFAYHGLASAFRRVGFTEVLRRSETRPIMRCFLKGRKTKGKR